eukprot:gene6080-4375_t
MNTLSISNAITTTSPLLLPLTNTSIVKTNQYHNKLISHNCNILFETQIHIHTSVKMEINYFCWNFWLKTLLLHFCCEKGRHTNQVNFQELLCVVEMMLSCSIHITFFFEHFVLFFSFSNKFVSASNQI